MYDEIIFEDGIITLNGEEVPGILRSLSVDGKVRFDEQQVDGASGKSKTPQGFEDSEISISLYLCTDDESSCYDKLEILSELFRKIDDKANPQIYELSSHHLFLRGIRQAVFSRLSTSENDKSDEIIATLGFVEHNPPVVKLEKAQAKTPTPKELAEKAKEKTVGQTPAAQPQADAGISDDSIKIDIG